VVTIASRSKPKYFFVAFGDPDPAQHKPPVEDGYYPHEKGFIANSGMRIGDIVLLYCTEGYLKHTQEAPGIGIVTDIETVGEKEKFYYNYLRLDPPVNWDTIKRNVSELTALKGRTNFSWSGNWLREISNISLQRVLSGKQIIWP